MLKVEDYQQELIDRAKNFETQEPSNLLTLHTRHALSGAYIDEFRKVEFSTDWRVAHSQDTLARYIANGFCDLEEGLESLTSVSGRIASYFKRRPAPPAWIDYTQKDAHLPLHQIEVPYRAFTNTGLNASLGQRHATLILQEYFPDLAREYKQAPETFGFRYVSVDSWREETFGNIQENINTYGVDYDLSRGWEGVWIRQGEIYGGGFTVGRRATSSYLMIYRDHDNLFGGHGFYDEGALDFTRLVIADTTLKQLLSQGAVLKIVNDLEG